jgi:hypothetical protein
VPISGSESIITTAAPIIGAPVLLSTTVPRIFCVRIFWAGRLKHEKKVIIIPGTTGSKHIIFREIFKQTKLKMKYQMYKMLIIQGKNRA